MVKKLKIGLYLLALFYFPLAISIENRTLQDISITADTVKLDEQNNELIFSKNIKIVFGDLIIMGNEAMLSYNQEKLIINGSPVSIASETRKINGIADQFIIYPNKSIEMVGKAQLINGGRSINSELITYQINSND
jgi:lipopolysaccharide transport protein LptA|tara:strand:- start:253 stop:660 length:408 start_codon:yes stop_codon:yes gene_type:complete